MIDARVSDKTLGGWRVLVTRPVDQAHRLCMLIERGGGEPRHFPLTAIEPIDETGPARALLARGDWNWLIFVSSNAARYACQLPTWSRDLPPATRIAAIGPGTARKLHDAGLTVDLTPKAQFNSEALLATAELQALRGARILIVRGSGGRELLATTLRERGAAVEYAEVYRRVRPQMDVDTLIADWEQGRIDACTVTSTEALRNLAELLGPDHVELLRRTPIAVLGERIAEHAAQLGCRRIGVAQEASDDELCAAIARLANSR